MNIKDRNLLRQQCFVDGAWVDADDKAVIAAASTASRLPV